MHERTQRAIARLMFVFCCAVPTCLTFLCILVTWTPWHHHRTLRAIEARLSQSTGLQIEIDDFQRSSPSTLELFSVRVVEPESQNEVARVREIQWVDDGKRVSILLQQPEVRSRELRSVWDLLHDRFLCRPDQTSLPVRAAANDLTIHSRTGDLTFTDIDAWIRQGDRTIEATIEGLPANTRSDSPVSVSVLRDRNQDLPSTQWTLDTRGTALPCSAVAEFIPQMEGLGTDAEYTGTMRWQIDAETWSVDLSGSSFSQISLDRLFERHTHRLTGSATLWLERCRIEPQMRRSDIAGSIVARDGMVGRSLLHSCQQHFGFQLRLPTPLIDRQDDSVPFDRLAVGFNVNNTQLELNGICRSERGYEGFPSDVALCLDGYPLVFSTDGTLDSLKVITAIAPAHSVLIPMSDQTRWLTKVFIPPSRPLPHPNAQPPRIRSAENFRGGPTISQPR
ncbi:MAG: hypothetical protein ACR2NZ_26195 [Rubripirellula sp.]